jgi:hypothetical protein
MKIHRRTLLTAAASISLLGGSSMALAQQAPVTAGFTSLFDGKTLNGWRGDTSVWSVKDGTIQASSDAPILYNTFLILNKPYANFELRLKYRFLTPQGNSGVQFRSGQVEGNHVLAGMQSNITTPTFGKERFGFLYEELGRVEMVYLGQKAEITRRQAKNGGQGAIVRTVTGTVNSQDDVVNSVKPSPEWNEDVLIVYGNRIVHALNGFLAFDATDNDPLGAKDGLIGLQAHAGPPMTLQFKDIEIRPLTSFPDIAGRFKTNPGPAPTPARTQINISMQPVQAAAK